MSKEHLSVEEVQQQVRKYVFVFVALLVLTVITVSVSYLHLSVGKAILLALVVAAIKGSLVACYFMHLMSERKIIYWSLLLTVAFFAVLLFLPTAQLLNLFSGVTH